MKKIIIAVLIFALMLGACSNWSVEIKEPESGAQGSSASLSESVPESSAEIPAEPGTYSVPAVGVETEATELSESDISLLMQSLEQLAKDYKSGGAALPSSYEFPEPISSDDVEILYRKDSAEYYNVCLRDAKGGSRLVAIYQRLSGADGISWYFCDAFDESVGEMNIIELGVPLSGADFLTEEQKALYLRGRELLWNFGVETGFGSGVEPEDKVTVNVGDQEIYYYPCSKYPDWEGFYSNMTSVFSENFFKSSNALFDGTEKYKNIDGKVYFSGGGRGTNPLYCGEETDTFEFAYSGDETLSFYLIARYKGTDSGSYPTEYTEQSEVTMVKTEDGWRIDFMFLPY